MNAAPSVRGVVVEVDGNQSRTAGDFTNGLARAEVPESLPVYPNTSVSDCTSILLEAQHAFQAINSQQFGASPRIA